MFKFGKSKKQVGIEREAVLTALSKVMDPDLNRDIVSLGFVKKLDISGRDVGFEVELATPADKVKERLKKQCEDAVRAIGAEKVSVNVTVNVRGARVGTKRLIPGVRNVLAVASGKGGVGKSTVAMNLALALLRRGARVGLLDCDIYGPSLPTMIGAHPQPRALPDKRFVPIDVFGLQTMSMGFLIPPGQAATWRGPMAHKMIQQFLFGVAWGELDYLILDLPPGTGDVQLSLTQETPLSAGLVVTTPQEAALRDARKGLEMFRQVGLPVIGFVENMSYYLCRKCTKRHALFGEGGGARLAKEYQLPLLAQIPVDSAMTTDATDGRPLFVREKEGACVEAFAQLARQVATELSKLSELALANPGPQIMEV